MQTVNTPVSTALEDRINRAGHLWYIESEITKLDNNVVFMSVIENGMSNQRLSERERWWNTQVSLYFWLKRTNFKLWLSTNISEFGDMCWRIKERERVRRVSKLFS